MEFLDVEKFTSILCLFVDDDSLLFLLLLARQRILLLRRKELFWIRG
jgi:hypothetical protein